MKTILALALSLSLVSATPASAGELCGADSTSLQTNLDSLTDAFRTLEGIEPQFNLVGGEEGLQLIRIIVDRLPPATSALATKSRDFGTTVLWVPRPSDESVIWGIFDKEDCLIIYGVASQTSWRQRVLNDS